MCRIAMISVHTCPLAKLGSDSAGGMNVYVRGLSQELGRNGMSVDIFTRWSDPNVPRVVHIDEQTRVIHLKAGPVGPVAKSGILQHLPEFVCNLRLFRQEQGLDYRLIHSHYWYSGWVAGMLRHKWNVPGVVMFHTLGAVKNNAHRAGNESPQRIEAERRIISTADLIVASSRHERHQMIDIYGAKPEGIRIIPCGIDLDQFQPIDKRAARHSLGLNDTRTLLFVGRIEPLKAVDVLLKAMARLPGILPDIQLLVLGGDPNAAGEMSRLRSLATELGIVDQVSFVGSVDHSRLPLYYSAADLCVVPSHYESFSLAAAEALSCGTPVVAARVGGLQSLVHHLKNGFLTPSHSPDAFAGAISSLMENEPLRLALAGEARPSVQHLGWPAVAAEVLAAYDDLAQAELPAQLCLCGRR
ncbi:MAG: glycosyltransferase [Chloroflexi bacterium]|nr:glycosyltransferase [Chloroflexota bacterium]